MRLNQHTEGRIRRVLCFRGSFIVASLCFALLSSPEPPIAWSDDPQVDGAPSHAVPSDESLIRARQLVEELYASQLARAGSSTRKVQLAAEILAVARDTSEGGAGQYALLELAETVSASSGDFPLALEIFRFKQDIYDLDSIAERNSLLVRMASATRSVDSRNRLIDFAKALVRECRHVDDLETAESSAKIGLEVARRHRLASDIEHFSQAIHRVREQRERRQKAADARLGLAENPADVEFNKVVGTHECFMKDNWERGLAHLLISGDEQLQKLAKLELDEAPPANVLAGQWWSFADSTQEWYRDQAFDRSRHWYRQAKPGLTGLDLKIANFRIGLDDEMEPASNPVEVGVWHPLFPNPEVADNWEEAIPFPHPIDLKVSPLSLRSEPERDSALLYPLGTTNAVIRAKARFSSEGNLALSLRRGQGSAYSFGVTHSGNLYLGYFDGQGFRNVKTRRVTLPRGPFKLQAAVYGDTQVMWLNGSVVLNANLSKVQSGSNVAINVHDTRGVDVYSIDYLLPSERQKATLNFPK